MFVFFWAVLDDSAAQELTSNNRRGVTRKSACRCFFSHCTRWSNWWYDILFVGKTCLTVPPLKMGRNPNVFQPSIFRGEMLVSGRVVYFAQNRPHFLPQNSCFQIDTGHFSCVSLKITSVKKKAGESERLKKRSRSRKKPLGEVDETIGFPFFFSGTPLPPPKKYHNQKSGQMDPNGVCSSPNFYGWKSGSGVSIWTPKMAL